MEQFSIDACDVEIGSITSSSFEDILENRFGTARKIILVDENTHDNCLEYIITSFPGLEEAEVMLLPVGEENKVIEVCFQVWQAMSEYNIERGDLVINVGGGVVTDMGGFIASVFKRGLTFINIPTTLLGMVDAAVGGKTGIDLGPYKNQLGVIRNPLRVYIDPIFLQTLPEEQLVSGYAEMIKHALIADKEQWHSLCQLDPVKLVDNNHFLGLIAASVSIKGKVVAEDFEEKGRRKILNFGHTIGHGIEGYFLDTAPVAHGHAVAYGMIAETYLSYKRDQITQRELLEITNYLTQLYDHIPIHEEDRKAIVELMKQDKKNQNGEIRTVLLKGIGDCTYDNTITVQEADEALIYVESVYTSN